MAFPLRSTRRLLIILPALALAACQSSTSNTPTSPPAGGDPVQTATVTANPNNTFSPSIVNLLAGGTVTFTNGGGTHNVNASGSLNFRCANGCDGDGQGGNGNAAEGWSFTITFPSPGSTNYFCEPHQNEGMAGVINVQ